MIRKAAMAYAQKVILGNVLWNTEILVGRAHTQAHSDSRKPPDVCEQARQMVPPECPAVALVQGVNAEHGEVATELTRDFESAEELIRLAVEAKQIKNLLPRSPTIEVLPEEKNGSGTITKALRCDIAIQVCFPAPAISRQEDRIAVRRPRGILLAKRFQSIKRI